MEKGTVTILAHSLGSVAVFDILSHFRDQLTFKPSALMLIGSPLGLFIPVKNWAPEMFSLMRPVFSYTAAAEAASGSIPILNLFHPADPVAWRIEPLLRADMSVVAPYSAQRGAAHRLLESSTIRKRLAGDPAQRRQDIALVHELVNLSAPPAYSSRDAVVDLENTILRLLPVESRDSTSLGLLKLATVVAAIRHYRAKRRPEAMSGDPCYGYLLSRLDELRASMSTARGQLELMDSPVEDFFANEDDPLESRIDFGMSRTPTPHVTRLQSSRRRCHGWECSVASTTTSAAPCRTHATGMTRRLRRRCAE